MNKNFFFRKKKTIYKNKNITCVKYNELFFQIYILNFFRNEFIFNNYWDEFFIKNNIKHLEEELIRLEELEENIKEEEKYLLEIEGFYY